MKIEWLLDNPMPTSEDGTWQLSDTLPSEAMDGETAMLYREAVDAGYESVDEYLAN